MSKIKIALLCNNRVAIPVLQGLAQEHALCGVAIADNDRETAIIFGTLVSELRTGLAIMTRKGYAEELAAWIHDTQADVVFVINFPWRIPASVLRLPRYGFLNFHFGLLPEMRGADPVFETIRQRMTTGGVTVHLMDEGLDTGQILLRRELPVGPGVTHGMLSSQMAQMSAEMCSAIMEGVLRQAQDDNTAQYVLRQDHDSCWCGMPLTKQDETNAKYWPKVSEREITIDWQGMDSAAIMALVCACNPVAKGVPTTINGWKIGVVDVTEVNLQGDASSILPGTIVVADAQNGLIVYCRDGKGLKLEVVHTAEGTFAGYKLGFFGIGQGMTFN